jgi:chaperonin GroEL (HSP60 family)
VFCTGPIPEVGCICCGNNSCFRANPIQSTRGIKKTVKALVLELKSLSKEVEDSEVAEYPYFEASRWQKWKISQRSDVG